MKGRIMNWCSKLKEQANKPLEYANKLKERADNWSIQVIELHKDMKFWDEKSIKPFTQLPKHVSFLKSPSQLPGDLGKAFVRYKDSQGKTAVRYATEEEALESNVIAFGGLDFDDRKSIGVLGKALDILTDPKPQGFTMKPIIVHPLVDKETRFKSASSFNHDKYYFAPYIEDLTRAYVLPRFLSEDKKTIVMPKKGFTLFSYSVAGREVMMIERALVEIFLKEYNKTIRETQDLLLKMDAVCIAYADDTNGISNLSFPKIVLFSLRDFLVERPESLKMLLRHYEQQTVEILEGTKPYMRLSYEYPVMEAPHVLILLGKDVVPLVYKGKEDESDGHGLYHYAEGIKNLPAEVYEDVLRRLLIREKPIDLPELPIIGATDTIPDIGDNIDLSCTGLTNPQLT